MIATFSVKITQFLVFFPQFKVKKLAQFSIPNLSDKNKLSKITVLVQKIMDKEGDEEELNRKIDDLVMELVDLNEYEKQSVREFKY